MKSIAFILVLMGIAPLIGCSADDGTDDLPETVSAEGVLTLDGKPLEGASIVLSPSDTAGYAASAISGSNGKFRLQSFPMKEGAVPGAYQIAVTKSVESGGAGAWKPEDFGEDAAHAAESPPPSSMKNVLPVQYADPKTSGLSLTIPPEGLSEHAIELISTP